MAEGHTRNAKTWLAELRMMGERLALQSEPRYANVAWLGLDIQAKVIERLGANDPAVNEELVVAKTHILSAIDELRKFESTRDERIAVGEPITTGRGSLSAWTSAGTAFAPAGRQVQGRSPSGELAFVRRRPASEACLWCRPGRRSVTPGRCRAGRSWLPALGVPQRVTQ